MAGRPRAARRSRKTALAAPPPLPLVTRRLAIREFLAGDRDALQRLAADPRVIERAPVPGRALAAASRAPAARTGQLRRGRRSFEFAVVLRRGARLIGACDLALTGRREADIGYLIAPAHWGYGYGSEAAGALVDFGFRVLGLARVSAVVAVDNDRSRRVLRNAGLQWAGLARRHARLAGRWHDCHRYTIDRDRWAALVAARRNREVTRP